MPSLSDSEIKFEIVIESNNTTFLKTTKGRGSIGNVELIIIINLCISKMEKEEKLDNSHNVGSVILWEIILGGTKASLDLIHLEILDNLL